MTRRQRTHDLATGQVAPDLRGAGIGLIVALLVAMLMAGVALAESRQPAAPANLLANPSFEGPYSSYVPPDGHPDCPFGVCQTAQMAAGWTPFWRSHDPQDPGYIYRMPEYKRAEAFFDNPSRVHSGDAAQQYFTFFATHQAGLYQRVAVQKGANYCFQVWGHSWSAQDDDDAYSGPEDGELFQQVGIDPWGGRDWRSPDVIWGAARIQYDEYGRFSVCAQARAAAVTVFTLSEPRWAVKHNDVYWDDAELILVEGTASLEPAFARYLVDRDSPVSESLVVTVTQPVYDGIHWQARLLPGGTLPVTLEQAEGWSNEAFRVSISSVGLRRGTYEAEVEVTLEPALPGSPLRLPLSVTVYPELHQSLMPLIVAD